MSLIKKVKKARDETPLSSLYPITHLNTPSIFETKSGFLGSVIKVQGAPFITEEDESLNALSYSLHQAITQLDERFLIYVTTHRKKESLELEGAFKSKLAKTINDKYHARFKEKALYKNNLYLTLVLKGDTSDKTGKLLGWLNRLFDIGSPQRQGLRRQESIKVLVSATGQLLASLRSFHPHLLGDKDESLGFSELLAFLSLIPNAGQDYPFQEPACCPAIAKSIPESFKAQALYPEGHLGQYLSSKRILFGNYIQFQGVTLDEVQFGAILTIKKYPKLTSSVVFDPILRIDSEFIATHSFAPITREAALWEINSKREKLINAEDLSLSQIEALSTLEDNIASEEVLLGHHHHTLLLLAPDIKRLEETIHFAVKEYNASGTVVVKEILGEEPAFFAQIPGNHHLIARAALISSHNFIDFCPLHNMQTGFRDSNHLGSAVTLLETPFKTPVFFNYHGKSSSTNPAPGHTLIFGGTNSGKTTTLSFLDSQMSRYGGRTFYLDRNCSSKIYIKAFGNSCYTVIHPDNAKHILMNPLQLDDTLENRTFIKSWFASLLLHPQEKDLPATITELVNEAVNYNFDHLDKPYRMLSNLSKLFPLDFPRWSEFRRWLKGNESFDEGEFAWLFDNSEDALQFNFDKIGFDVTWLMDSVSEWIATPVYHYLVHRMNQCLDGRLTTFNIEEAFAVFKTPFWVDILNDWVPTIRKKNGHDVFATQSPPSMLNSALSVVLKDNIETEIFFPNSKASEEIYIEQLNLSYAQYQFIVKTSKESHLFLYRQGGEAIICKVDLSGMEEEIRILSSNDKSNQLADMIRAELGEDENLWLPEFIKRSA